MPTNILMPALSPTMEKGNLAKWLKKEGDKIKSGDVIAEIETDKATMEYEAVDDGTLAKIVVPEGTQDVAVNSVIAVLANEGEDVKAAASASAKAPAAPKRKSRKNLMPNNPRRPPADAGYASPLRRRPRRRSTVFAQPVPTAFSLRPWPAVWRRKPIFDLEPRAGLWPAWPRHRARYRAGKIRQGIARAEWRPGGGRPHRAGDVGCTDPRRCTRKARTN